MPINYKINPTPSVKIQFMLLIQKIDKENQFLIYIHYKKYLYLKVDEKDFNIKFTEIYSISSGELRLSTVYLWGV